MKIEVLHLGIGTTHGDDFVFSRPRGMRPAWVFMHLPIPLEIDTALGRERSHPGDCILHDPPFPQMHRSLPGGFHNDWMHFHGPDLGQVLRECKLPTNRLLRFGSTDFIRAAMLSLRNELDARGLHWQRRAGSLTADLLWQLSRRVHTAEPAFATRAEALHFSSLSILRGQMLSQFRRVWTIPEMARRTNLSPPRFSVLYRHFFSSSPNDDLIRARIEHAKFLLAHTSLPIKSVADESGFSNVYYFSRTFRARVGCAARDYLRPSTTRPKGHVRSPKQRAS